MVRHGRFGGVTSVIVRESPCLNPRFRISRRVAGAELRLSMTITLPRFRVETEVEGGAALVSLFGELDRRVTDYCEARLSDVELHLRHVEPRLRHVIVDLRGLTVIDASGVQTLVRAHMRSRMGGWRLTLVHGPPSVDDVFMPRFIEELFDWIDSAAAVFPPPVPPGAIFESGR
jgi:anti-anti-sigma factor